ncbi:DDE transposase family protein [Leptolyngbya sp. 'hensonii']|uniref:DDE transposase family protein n=1 Tax=Leptolyngbya sp. 'hensonii' TaxID=1922337 RepID=UPI00094F6AF4|nr:DDE transposase family protein [Leptolyngbya sp. 'hensonii']OLP19087.1 DDE transposase family protein [Leptolyngbya sp. 'hensonii']
MTSSPEEWYILKQENGHCQILPASQVNQEAKESPEQWGPFTSEAEAIARRVGLIRAGKCQPM